MAIHQRVRKFGTIFLLQKEERENGLLVTFSLPIKPSKSKNTNAGCCFICSLLLYFKKKFYWKILLGVIKITQLCT